MRMLYSVRMAAIGLRRRFAAASSSTLSSGAIMAVDRRLACRRSHRQDGLRVPHLAGCATQCSPPFSVAAPHSFSGLFRHAHGHACHQRILRPRRQASAAPPPTRGQCSCCWARQAGARQPFSPGTGTQRGDVGRPYRTGLRDILRNRPPWARYSFYRKRTMAQAQCRSAHQGAAQSPTLRAVQRLRPLVVYALVSMCMPTASTSAGDTLASSRRQGASTFA